MGILDQYQNYALGGATLGAIIILRAVLKAPVHRLIQGARLRRYISRNPAQPDGWFNYGLLLFDDGRYESAERHFKLALALEPHSARAPYYLGKCRLNQGDKEGAAPYFQKALEISPTFAIAFQTLAEVQHAQGSIIQAEVLYRKALYQDKSLAAAHFGLARIYGICFEPAKAAEHLREAIQREESYLGQAKECQDFDRVSNDPGFRELVYGAAA